MGKVNRKKPEAGDSQSKGNGPQQRVKESGGGSSATLWLLLLVITAGTGFGFYYVFEEMKSANESVRLELHTVKDELNTVKDLKSQAVSLLDGLKALEVMKETVKNLQSDQSSFEEKFESFVENQNGLRSELNQEKTQILDIKSHLDDTKSSVQSLKHQVEESNEKLSDDIKGYSAVSETNLEGFAKDIAQLSANDKALTDKLTKAVNNFNEVEGQIMNLMKSSQDVENRLKAKLTESSGTMQKLEETLSEQLSLLQQSTANQFTELTKQLVESKQDSQSLQGLRKEVKENLKSEVAEALSSVGTQIQSLSDSANQIGMKQKSLEDELRTIQLKIVTDQDMNVVKEEISSLADQTSKTAEAYVGVQAVIDQTSQNIERKIATLTAHVRAAKDDLSAMRDEVKAVSDSVAQISSVAGEAKRSADSTGTKPNDMKDQTDRIPNEQSDSKKPKSPK